MDDPLPAIEAAIDQRIAEAPMVARVAVGVYDAFIAAGFSSSQALYLTATQLLSHPGPAPE